MPKVTVELSDDKTEATVSVSFPWLKQAYAFAAICQAVLSHMKPLVEGEDKVIVKKKEG